jgi:hypothetical protein
METNAETVEQTTVESAPVADVPAETTTDEQAPATYDDLWNIDLKLPEESAEAEPTAEKPAEALPADEPAKPEATDSPESNKTDDSDDADDPIEARLENHDPNKPVKLSRRQSARLVENIIEPFRDENTPIEDVFKSLAEFQPVRTQQLAETLVHNSLQADPDGWLKAITGLDLTVAQVKAFAEGGGQPLNTAETIDNPKPTQATGYPAEIEAGVNALTEMYGDKWRDPASDADIPEFDLPLVKALRAAVTREDAHNAELGKVRADLEALKPQVEQIAQAKETEFQTRETEVFQTDATQFRDTVEAKAFGKAFEMLNLKDAENDPDDLKLAKNLIRKQFESPHGNATTFDTFLSNDFSGKEQVGKAIQRVGAYLKQAAAAEANALRSPAKAETLKANAAALRAQANAEQDALIVWTQRAAQEFVNNEYGAVLRLIERNAELERSRGTGRQELVGGKPPATNGWEDQVKAAVAKGVNPFDLDLSSRV